MKKVEMNAGSVVVIMHDHPEWQFYTKYHNGNPVAYRYGDELQATRLFIEGGYETEQKAVEAWINEILEGNNEEI